MAKNTKKGAIEKIEGVTVKLGTGLAFVIGESIRPVWNDLYATVYSLYNKGYIADLVPPGMTEDLVLTSTQAQIEYLVPAFLRAIDNGFDSGKYDIAKDYRLLAAAYVMAWYWHIRLGGPRPYITRSTHYTQRPKVYQNTPELRCPFCNTPFVPNPRYKKASVIFQQWVTWLPKHAKVYHKWIDTKNAKAYQLIPSVLDKEMEEE